MLLASSSYNGLDITAEIEVLAHTFVGQATTVAIARIDFDGVVGNGVYYANFYLNDNKVLPNFAINIDAGRTAFVAQSKDIILTPGDVVSLRVRGLSQDTSVSIRAYLFEVGSLSDVEDAIQEAIRSGLSHTTVRPERTVLGPCKRTVRQGVRKPVKRC